MNVIGPVLRDKTARVWNLLFTTIQSWGKTCAEPRIKSIICLVACFKYSKEKLYSYTPVHESSKSWNKENWRFNFRKWIQFYYQPHALI